MSDDRPPKKDCSDFQLAEHWHLYKTAPDREAAVSVTTIIKPLTDANILSQAKAKQTAEIAAMEADQQTQRTIAHRAFLLVKYDGWKPWQQKKYAKVDLSDDSAVYYDWLRMEVDRRWKAKADLGSRVHQHAYDLSMGRDIDALDDELPYVTAWGRYVEENGVEFIPSATERVVVHPSPLGHDELEYGGRDDLFAIHHKGPTQGWIVGDYKTGGCYPTQVTLQLSGYRFGAGFATYDETGRMKDEYDNLPSVAHAVGIYLHDDATYSAKEFPANEAAFATFMKLRDVVNFQTTMKPYEKEATAEWAKKQK